MKIENGIKKRPQKIVLYGLEGIGKSTLASSFPSPLFLDTENGTDHLSVRRVRIGDWMTLLEATEEVGRDRTLCKTLVLDTADKADEMCAEYIAKKYHTSGLEGFPYGKGYVYLAEEFEKLLNMFNSLLGKGINIVVLAHAKMRKFENPDEMGAYDRWEMKLSRSVAPSVKEWADALLFLSYRTIVVTGESGVRKARGGERVIYTTHTPIWDAKNRYGMEECLPLEYNSIRGIIEENTVPSPYEALLTLMEKDGVTESDVVRVVTRKGTYPIATPITAYSDEFISEWLIANWEQIKKLIKSDADKAKEKENE